MGNAMNDCGLSLAALFASACVVLLASSAMAADAGRGEETYLRVGCWQCHGYAAQGASTGPNWPPILCRWKRSENLSAFRAIACRPIARRFFPTKKLRTFTPIWRPFHPHPISRIRFSPSRRWCRHFLAAGLEPQEKRTIWPCLVTLRPSPYSSVPLRSRYIRPTTTSLCRS